MLGQVPWADPAVVASILDSIATVLGALIVGGLGAWIGARFTRMRDLQDKESEWRGHAIELTKLDMERKLKTGRKEGDPPLRPCILDFLANYRDLQELGEVTPKDLYLKIRQSRISPPADPDAEDSAQDQADQSSSLNPPAEPNAGGAVG